MKSASILLIALLGSACAVSTVLGESDADTSATLEPRTEQVTPRLWFAFASMDPVTRERLSLVQASELLESDGEAAALLHALANAGWSQSESAALVTIAAGHNSGASYDTIRARQVGLRNDIGEAFERFERTLQEAEVEQGIAVDRRQLFSSFYGHVSK